MAGSGISRYGFSMGFLVEPHCPNNCPGPGIPGGLRRPNDLKLHLSCESQKMPAEMLTYYATTLAYTCAHTHTSTHTHTHIYIYIWCLSLLCFSFLFFYFLFFPFFSVFLPLFLSFSLSFFLSFFIFWYLVKLIGTTLHICEHTYKYN